MNLALIPTILMKQNVLRLGAIMIELRAVFIAKNISQVKKILQRKLQKKQLLILTIIAVAQALTVIAQVPMVVQAPTVIAQVLMVVQAHIVVALRKKAVHQLADILHIVVVVLQVLHINLMMRDTSLYMMTMTMIGTDTIAIQTMPMV